MSHVHIKIYQRVPLNTGKSKYPDLTPYQADWDFGEALSMSFDPRKRRKDMLGPNTAQRFYIERGFISDKYDEEPYIVPFIAPGSKKAVLVVPGGAYQDVSLDQEGYPTCEYLQAHGITAFALKYRVYPYLYPAAMLDCRRAICYIKAHAEDFGIDANELSILGYSAGGNLVATTVYLFNELPHIEGYEEDEIDKVDPRVKSLAPIYGELMADRFLLSLQFGDELLKNDAYYEEIKEKYYLPQYAKENKTPVFVCCASDDGVVDPNNSFAHAKACFDAGVRCEFHLFPEGGHGFGVAQQDFPPMFGLPSRRMGQTREWVNLYIRWIETL